MKGTEVKRNRKMRDTEVMKEKEKKEKEKIGTIKVEGSKGRVESRTVSRRPESEALLP